MERSLSITFTGEMLASLEFIAAQRDSTVASVLQQAVSHELWLHLSTSAGRKVVAEGAYDREELILS